jgi:hypothetical protein
LAWRPAGSHSSMTSAAPAQRRAGPGTARPAISSRERLGRRCGRARACADPRTSSADCQAGIPADNPRPYRRSRAILQPMQYLTTGCRKPTRWHSPWRTHTLDHIMALRARRRRPCRPSGTGAISDPARRCHRPLTTWPSPAAASGILRTDPTAADTASGRFAHACVRLGRCRHDEHHHVIVNVATGFRPGRSDGPFPPGVTFWCSR